MSEMLHSISHWHDSVKGDLNQASGLVLLTLVVFINCCLGFCIVTWLSLHLFCWYQPSDWLEVRFAPVKWVAEKVVCKMTYIVSDSSAP